MAKPRSSLKSTLFGKKNQEEKPVVEAKLVEQSEVKESEPEKGQDKEEEQVCNRYISYWTFHFHFTLNIEQSRGVGSSES